MGRVFDVVLDFVSDFRLDFALDVVVVLVERPLDVRPEARVVARVRVVMR